MRTRRCSRAGCSLRATATLTYVYSDSTAVVGPLARQAEPHCYDLCSQHASALSVPRGWEVIRLAVDSSAEPNTDDLLALADAVREVGLSYDLPPVETAPRSQRPAGIREVGRRGHLTMLVDPGDPAPGNPPPTEPAPTSPAPTEPAPTSPAPIDPAPPRPGQ